MRQTLALLNAHALLIQKMYQGTAPIPQPLERQVMKLAALAKDFYTP